MYLTVSNNCKNEHLLLIYKYCWDSGCAQLTLEEDEGDQDEHSDSMSPETISKSSPQADISYLWINSVLRSGILQSSCSGKA